MRFLFEMVTNPGPAVWFMTNLLFESSEVIPGYWGLNIGWWMFKDLENWFLDYSFDDGGAIVMDDGSLGTNWSLYRVRLLGFEIAWERWRE